MIQPAAHAPKRVALDGCCFVGNATGIANYVGALLQGMCEQHPEVTFYSLANEAGITLGLSNLVYRVSTPRRRGPIWQNTQLVEMLAEESIDVLWGTNGVIPLRGLGRTATVVTIHDLVHRFAPATQLPMIRWKQRVFQPLSVRSAQRVVAVSEATASDVARHYGRGADVVIHPSAGDSFRRLDSLAAAALITEFELPDRFILCVGTLEPRKNVAALIEAYWRCRELGIALPQLVLVGGGGWFNDRLRGLIDKASAQGCLRYLGYVATEKLAALYARCTLYVMPSLYEGFGMPLLEAQSCGAPVVHGSHPSMAEAAGGVGVGVEPSVEGLFNMLQAFARDELPLACRLHVRTDNDRSRSAANMWQVLVEAWREKEASQRG